MFSLVPDRFLYILPKKHVSTTRTSRAQRLKVGDWNGHGAAQRPKRTGRWTAGPDPKDTVAAFQKATDRRDPVYLI